MRCETVITGDYTNTENRSENNISLGVDLTRLRKTLKKRAMIIAASSIAGILAGFLLYKLYGLAQGGDIVYRVSNDYFVYHNFDIPNGRDYFNAYTWDTILRDDPIVNCALEKDDTIPREAIMEYVKGEILSDYRVITVNVTGKDSALTEKIARVYREALPEFADKTDMILSIEPWTDNEIEEYDRFTRDGNAALLGGLIGFLAGLFGVLIAFFLDEGIYTERDWRKFQYAHGMTIPWLGRVGTKEYILNRDYILRPQGDKDVFIHLPLKEFTYSPELLQELRDSKGVVLGMEEGAALSLVESVLYTLVKQDVAVAAVETIQR